MKISSKNAFSITACLGLLLFFISCSGSMDGDRYKAWVQDYANGLHVKKTSAGYVFDVQYMPGDYLSLQREGTSQGMKQGALQHYTLTIGFENEGKDLIKSAATNEQERQQRVYYFSYRFQDDIYLEEGGERIPCVLYHFERANDLKPKRTFLLGFEEAAKPGEDALLVIDSPLFGSLPVKVRISKSNIPTPEL